ncbi:hypothetical protein Vretimale_14204 [Volvox reticuliferus]|uniref:Uncharacterized protein n=1 Tax=Volvox reticuliferus TaxID=1737510 RepID=A0A8J4GN55_9CHLO|nr:hypothetical protein Vretimale_14204 [Volvox reticuliferus]
MKRRDPNGSSDASDVQLLAVADRQTVALLYLSRARPLRIIDYVWYSRLASQHGPQMLMGCIVEYLLGSNCVVHVSYVILPAACVCMWLLCLKTNGYPFVCPAGPSYHPFELGSPAGRTMHVVVPELQPPAAGRIGFSPYFAAMDKEQTPSGAEMLGPVATTQSVRKYDRRTGAYYEISDNGALGTGCSYPHDGGRSDADGGGGDNGGEFHGFGGPCGQSAAANAPPSSAGKRDAGHSAPATNLRPTAATGVTATTMGSAFVRQLGSPVLQELLMQSSPVKSHGSSRGDSAPQYKYQSLNEQPTPALPAVRGRHQPDSAAVSDTTTAPSLHAAHYRRPSSGAHSNASSTDAERVHPWTGGRGMDSMGMGSNGTPYESPSAPRYLRSSGGVVVSGGGSVGSNDATRAFDSRRSSIGELSDMSSLDAARVYPSMGADDPNSSTIRLHSADGSLELMAAVPLPHSSAYDSEGGEDVGCSRERRRSISGRSVGGGSWLLLSPTVVVMEASGGSGAAVRALDVDREEGAREVASGAEAAEAIANQVQSHATQHQDKQQEEQQNGQVDSDAGLIRHGSIAGADKHYSNQEEDGEQEPSVAASPTSPPPRTPYDADGGVGSGSGSTTPTPRADLSFAFHSASFAMREGSGDEDADGKDWLHRNNLDDDDGSGGRRGDGDGGRAYGRPGALTALGSHRVGHDDDYDVGDDDEILQTPTHDSSWTRLKLRNPSGGTGDGTAASDADSDAGGASAAAAAAASRRRWQIQQRDESASSAVPGAIGLYDGYSEEEAEDDREGTDNRYGARRRQREAMRSSESLPVSALSSTAAQRAAAADLYHSFSFPSTESAVRAAEAEAAAAAVSSSSLKAATLNNASGSAGSSTSGSVAGMLGSPAMVGISNITEGGGDVIHHRVARPIRILVPSSPRSSMGGWSVPSPVPSPYTHGVGAMRTPSPGGKNTNFSLRNHLNLTVSSCLFAETSSSDEGDEYEYGYDGDVGTRQYAESRLVVGYESSPQLQQRQLRQHAGSDEGGEDEGEDEDEVEEGEEVTSRPTSWPRDKAGEIGRRNEEEEALEVEEEEDIPLAGDDEDEATAAVAAWAYGDARRAVVEVAQAARNAGNGGGAGGGADGLAAGDD